MRCGYGLIVAEPQQVVNQIFMSALTAAFLALTISLFWEKPAGKSTWAKMSRPSITIVTKCAHGARNLFSLEQGRENRNRVHNGVSLSTWCNPTLDARMHLVCCNKSALRTQRLLCACSQLRHTLCWVLFLCISGWSGILLRSWAHSRDLYLQHPYTLGCFSAFFCVLRAVHAREAACTYHFTPRHRKMESLFYAARRSVRCEEAQSRPRLARE
jgi:hypothetical protein